jgi:hypothetical protein
VGAISVIKNPLSRAVVPAPWIRRHRFAPAGCAFEGPEIWLEIDICEGGDHLLLALGR